MKDPYEKGVARHPAPSLRCAPRGAERSINRGIGGLGIELRKFATRVLTF